MGVELQGEYPLARSLASAAKLGLWTGLALSLGRAAVLGSMDLAHGARWVEARLRLTEELPALLAMGIGSGLAVAAAAVVLPRLLPDPSWRRAARVGVVLAAAALFFGLLAGWGASDPARQVGLATLRGRLAAGGLGAMALSLATLVVFRAARSRVPSGRSPARGLWIPAALVLAVPVAWRGLALRTYASQHPDVVWIVVDTLRASALHDPGGRIHTPNLDALARDGIEFTRAFSHAPQTLPSHTALFSSRLPHGSGVLRNGESVPADLPLFPRWIQDHGYATRAVISIGTLDPFDGRRPRERTFQECVSGLPFIRRAHESQPAVLDMVERLPVDQPFFLFAHYADPHTPYCSYGTASVEAGVFLDGEPLASLEISNSAFFEAEVELAAGGSVLEVRSPGSINVRQVSIARGRQLTNVRELEGNRAPGSVRCELPNEGESPATVQLQLWLSDVPEDGEVAERYRLEVEHVDRFVGELVRRLQEEGLYEDCLLVMTSDHGEALGEHGRRGHGKNLFDELIHVPLVIKPPAGHPATRALSSRAGRLARHVDVVPTVLELMGLPGLPGQVGVSLARDVERTHLAEAYPGRGRDVLCLRDERYKLLYYPEQERFELYDLDRDPGELEDLYPEAPALRAPWTAVLQRAASRDRAAPGQVDPATAAMLQALGYAEAE